MPRIALLQINPTVGDFDANAELLLAEYERAVAMGADLAVAPELCLCGYPPHDLLTSRAFRERSVATAVRVAERTGETALIFGAAMPNELGEGKPIFNAAVLAERGEVQEVRAKSLLPTYDVFDERRYFAPARRRDPVVWRGMKLGLTVCEDIWRLQFGPDSRHPESTRAYGVDPIGELAAAGVDLIINISASPFQRGKLRQRHAVCRDACSVRNVPVVYVNQVGGNDSLVFDGASFVLDASGRVVAQANSFESQILLWDPEEARTLPDLDDPDDLGDIKRALELGLADYARKCGFREVVIGLSGGIDSALTAALAASALGPENVHGVSMPSRYSSGHSRDDAAALAKNLGCDYRSIPIEGVFGQFLDEFEPHFRGLQPNVAEENLQARIRGTMLMTLSNKFGWLVLSTGNKSEMAVGYSTLYGDSCGGLALIADLPKTVVYALSRYINDTAGREVIPNSTITKPPSAELRPDQLDSDSLPDYDVLDPILAAYIERDLPIDTIVEETGADEALVRRIIGMVDRAEYKRYQSPPLIRVTSKAFGWGRRMPIAQRWRHQK